MSPERLREVLDAVAKINPNLKFRPCFYPPRDLKYFMDGNAYDSLLSRGGANMWFWPSYGTEVMRLSDLNNNLTWADQEIHPTPFITGIYPIRLAQLYQMQDAWPEDSLFHQPDTLRKMLNMSLERSDGVILWHNTPIYLDADGKTIRTAGSPLSTAAIGIQPRTL